MSQTPSRTVALALVFGLGCNPALTPPRFAPPPPRFAPPPSSAVDGAAVIVAALPDAVDPVDAVDPTADVTPAEVQAVLDAWMRAQNTGDLAAYDRLYAARFTGVRRSGPRERRFDREGWMADRREMFHAAMQVAVRDVTVRAAPDLATVRFTQDFTRERFHDSGPKELLLVRVGGALVIAREEMLGSRLGDPSTTPAEPPAGALMHVLDHGGVRWVALARAPDDGTWTQGRPTVVARDERVVVTRMSLSEGVVPTALRSLQGQAVRAWAPDGTACEARLGDLAVLGRVDVHFGTDRRWRGEREDGTRGVRVSDGVVARRAWAESSDGGRVLVARLDAADGCSPAISWSRLSSQPAPLVFVPSSPDAALAGRALRRARSLPVWRRTQAEYRENQGTAPAWDTDVGSSGPAMTLWQAPGSARRFVTVNASTALGPCGNFNPHSTVVFELGGPQGLILHSDGVEPGGFDPVAAVDIDGDGVPEFVTAEGYARRTGAVFRIAVPLAVPFHDCGC